MEVELVKYQESFRDDWDKFVNESLNGTWIHTRAFFDHNPRNKTDDFSVLFRKGSKTQAVMPANLYIEDGKKKLYSARRATYGGFVVSNDFTLTDAVISVELLIEEARRESVHEIIIRNPFRIFHNAPCDESDYALWYHGFSIRSREVETAIELGDYAITASRFSSSTKRSIKKARQTLRVEQSDDYTTYWSILEKNLRLKHDLAPTHSLPEFLNLLSLVGRDKIRLFAAFQDQTMVGGIVVFIKNKLALHAQYIASDADFQELRPLNGVIDSACRWGCENGFRFLNLGTSNFDQGRGINEGLFRFKEGFGGRSVLRETMHLKLQYS